MFFTEIETCFLVICGFQNFHRNELEKISRRLHLTSWDYTIASETSRRHSGQYRASQSDGCSYHLFSEEGKTHVFSRKSGSRRVSKRIKNIIDAIMRKIFPNYKIYFIKHYNQLTFCTKRQTSCFDVAGDTATAGIYGERLPEVGKHAFKLPPAVVNIRRPRIFKSLLKM